MAVEFHIPIKVAQQLATTGYCISLCACWSELSIVVAEVGVSVSYRKPPRDLVQKVEGCPFGISRVGMGRGYGLHCVTHLPPQYADFGSIRPVVSTGVVFCPLKRECRTCPQAQMKNDGTRTVFVSCFPQAVWTHLGSLAGVILNSICGFVMFCRFVPMSGLSTHQLSPLEVAYQEDR